jgi:hypothetical protein
MSLAHRSTSVELLSPLKDTATLVVLLVILLLRFTREHSFQRTLFYFGMCSVFERVPLRCSASPLLNSPPNNNTKRAQRTLHLYAWLSRVFN